MKRTIIRPSGLPSTISTQVATPIMPSVVYASKDPNELDKQYEGLEKGFTYAREGHPNAEILASLVNKMEGASAGLVVSSGMAALTALTMGMLSSGDHILGGDQLYGRSLRLMTEDLPRFGIQTSFADPTNIVPYRKFISFSVGCCISIELEIAFFIFVPASTSASQYWLVQSSPI